MPPPTPTPRRAGGDELTAKEKAALRILASAALLVICLTLPRFIAQHSKDNFVLRELAFFSFISTIVFVPITLFTFTAFVYHIQGESIRYLPSLSLSSVDLLSDFMYQVCGVNYAFDSAYLVRH
ncbi:hypothetical protein ACLB2K_063781 [Fragaria x ananassa]